MVPLISVPFMLLSRLMFVELELELELDFEEEEGELRPAEL